MFLLLFCKTTIIYSGGLWRGILQISEAREVRRMGRERDWNHRGEQLCWQKLSRNGSRKFNNWVDKRVMKSHEICWWKDKRSICIRYHAAQFGKCCLRRSHCCQRYWKLEIKLYSSFIYTGIRIGKAWKIQAIYVNPETKHRFFCILKKTTSNKRPEIEEMDAQCEQYRF